jgi:hypothetical protein
MFRQPFCQPGASTISAPHPAARTLSRGLTDSNRKRLCPAGHSPHATRAIKNPRFPGDKPVNNGDNPRKSVFEILPHNVWLETSPVIASRLSALLIAAIAGCIALAPSRAQAQWWRSAPADFEECADKAEKAATREERTSLLSECNAKFAGRRKPGGGYSYFDFMQNRSFDIAGPNPTPEEQKKIDQHYTEFLDRERRNSIASAFSAKQQQQQLQQASLKSESDKAPLTTAAIGKPQAAASDLRSRTRTTSCPRGSFSCEWPRLSEGIKDLKKLFGSSPAKAKRS